MVGKGKRVALYGLIALLGLVFCVSMFFAIKPLWSKNQQETQARTEVSNFKVYKFDQFNFSFVLATVSVDNGPVALEELTTNEKTRLDQVDDFLKVLKEGGLDVDSWNLTSKTLKTGKNNVFIPIVYQDTKLLSVSALNKETADWKFDVTQALTDPKSLGSSSEKGKTPSSEKTPEKEPEGGSKEEKEVVYSPLLEVEPDLVESKLKDGSWVSMGYPSGIRVFVVKVDYHSKRRIQNASLLIKETQQKIVANKENLRIKGDKWSSLGSNVLVDTKEDKGFLLFEINSGEVDINNVNYSLQVELGS